MSGVLLRRVTPTNVVGRACPAATLGDVEDPLKLVPAALLLGGAAMYLLADVAFRYRHIRTLNTRPRVTTESFGA